MGTKIQQVIAFVQKPEIDVVDITMSIDVRDFLLEKSMLEENLRFQTLKFAGNIASIGRLMPKDSLRVVYRRKGLLSQKLFYNIKEGG